MSWFHKCNDHCKICVEGNDINKPNCVSCIDEYYLFTLNNSCLTSCPDNYVIDDQEKKCIVEPTISYSEFKNKISNYISSFKSSANNIQINGTDFTALIYSVDDTDPKEQLKYGISAIDLGNCIQKIKEYYNMSQEESLIVLNVESKKNETEEKKNNTYFDLGKNTYIKIYDSSKNELELSKCQENIKVMKYINDIEEEIFQYARNYSEQGVDVFNTKNDFFNDICFYYDNDEEKDIILYDRRIDYYRSATFCQYGCNYDSIDYELKIANCLCNSNAFKNDNIFNIKKEEKSSFDSKVKSSSNMFDLNFKVLKCANLAFNTKILKRNFGFFIMIGMLLLQIIFLFNFMSNGVIKIKKYMINYQSNKNQKNGNNSKSQKGNIINNQIIINNKIIKNNINNNFNKGNVKKYLKKGKANRSNKKKSDEISSKEKINVLKSNIYIMNPKKGNKNAKKNNNIHQVKAGIKKSGCKNNLLKFNKSRIKEDFEDLNYEKAIIYDKRSCCRIYLSILVDNQHTFTTFFGDSNLYLFYIKLSFLIFTFEISFFLNSLFYTDEYISEAYHNNGNLYFAPGLPKAICACIALIIIRNSLKMITNNKVELKQILIGKINNNNINIKYYTHLIRMKLEKLSNKLIVYFIIVIIFGLFFLYYVTAFCAVYRYSQKYIFTGFLISFCLDIIFSIAICLFISFLRFTSIKMKAKCLYCLSDILNLL